LILNGKPFEITNPGGLPFGQTMKKALSGYSRLRNHVMGRIFRELELIEQWGSGLRRIHELCKKMGLKPPVFEEEGNHFRSIIFSQKLEKAFLSKYEQKLVDYLKKHKTIQTQQAAKLWSLSDRTTRTRLNKMILKLFLYFRIKK
jgi:ATP-dependent DNA helicase RecG